MESRFLLLFKSFFAILFLLLCQSANSQIKALTPDGEEVNLFNDGTWSYVKDSSSNVAKIDTNTAVFSKKPTDSFQIKSTKTNVGVFFDSKSWALEKGKPAESSEYNFKSLIKDIYGKFITERIEIPLQKFPDIAISNARKVAPDARIIKKEFRNVNGNKVLCMQINGTIQGVNFVYLGYYYSSNKGTVQFVTYTTQSLLSEYYNSMQSLLNGLIVIKI